MVNQQVGDTAIASCQVRSARVFGSPLVDPTSLSAFATDPNGVTIPLSVVRLSIGLFYALVVLTSAGPWIVRFTGFNGIYPILKEDPFQVSPANGGGTPSGVQPGQPAPPVVTGTYTMNAGDTVLYVAAGANITMPATPMLSTEYTIISVSGSLETSPVTINGNGYSIMSLNPSTAYALTSSTQMITSGSSVLYRWNGTVMVLENYRS